jgi:saccharopine dehydrogenase-like NADP-dependent oxidoreductase
MLLSRRELGLKVVVLGGGGAMGMVTARDLAECPGVEVVIGEANLEQAEKVAKWTGSGKVSVQKVDVNNHRQLVEVIASADVVANATPYYLNLQVTRAAIDAGKPLTDLGGVYHMTLDQLELNEKARNAGVTVALGCGVAPGIADILAKYGADKLDTVSEVHIRYGEVNLEPVKYKWSFRTVLEEYTKGPVVYENGEFKQLEPFAGKHVFRFPLPIGERSCCYALYSGMATLPESIGKGVQNVDCAMSFVEEDEQRIHFLTEMGLTSEAPIRLESGEISPREFLLKCAPPPDVHARDAAGVVVEVIGAEDGQTVKHAYRLVQAYHEKYGVSALAYLTGMPLSVVAQMLGRGEIPLQGVLPPEIAVRPTPFWAELAKRRVKIVETTQTSNVL